MWSTPLQSTKTIHSFELCLTKLLFASERCTNKRQVRRWQGAELVIPCFADVKPVYKRRNVGTLSSSLKLLIRLSCPELGKYCVQRSKRIVYPLGTCFSIARSVHKCCWGGPRSLSLTVTASKLKNYTTNIIYLIEYYFFSGKTSLITAWVNDFSL